MIDRDVFEFKTAQFVTLGCKLNFAETATISDSLLAVGIRQATERESPDIIIVNTCSVTEWADKKCRQTIRRLHRDHPHARIVVTGCYAQLKADEISRIEGVDMVLGAGEKLNLVDYLSRLCTPSSDQNAHILHTRSKDLTTFSPSVSSEGRTRHFLKVQDGCDYHCSYCTIPLARGRSRNGSISSLVEQAKGVAQKGGKEIVLTGVNVGDFGRSTGENFLQLIRTLDGVQGIERFRISSIEPNLLTEEIIDFVARSERFAPHFHIPLQSGSDQVLALMKRRYRTDLFRQRVEMIKSTMPSAFIGVDVIVGSRGETQEAYEETYSFLSGLPISKLHVFTYSERAGTAALQIAHSVTPREKHVRSQQLIALSDQKLQDFYTSQIGTKRRLLVEHGDTGEYLYGFTENYIRVRVPYDKGLEGTVVPVRIEDICIDDPGVMLASLLSI